MANMLLLQAQSIKAYLEYRIYLNKRPTKIYPPPRMSTHPKGRKS